MTIGLAIWLAFCAGIAAGMLWEGHQRDRRDREREAMREAAWAVRRR